MTRHQEQLYLSPEELRRINAAPLLPELMTYRRFPQGRARTAARQLAISAVCQRPKHCPSQCTAKNCICPCHGKEGS